jgi:hypothetical protein
MHLTPDPLVVDNVVDEARQKWFSVIMMTLSWWQTSAFPMTHPRNHRGRGLLDAAAPSQARDAWSARGLPPIRQSV